MHVFMMGGFYVYISLLCYAYVGLSGYVYIGLSGYVYVGLLGYAYIGLSYPCVDESWLSLFLELHMLMMGYLLFV